MHVCKSATIFWGQLVEHIRNVKLKGRCGGKSGRTVNCQSSKRIHSLRAMNSFPHPSLARPSSGILFDSLTGVSPQKRGDSDFRSLEAQQFFRLHARQFSGGVISKTLIAEYRLTYSVTFWSTKQNRLQNTWSRESLIPKSKQVQ